MAADTLTHLKDWVTSVAGNYPRGTTAINGNLDDNLDMLQVVMRYELATHGTIASAATCDLGTKDEGALDISGVVTITSFGTVSAGIRKWVRFTGVLTLTYNVTSLILPTSANITTEADDVALLESLGSGNWRCLLYFRKSGSPLLVNSLSDGTAAAPALAFTLDTNTGLYRVGADSLGVSAGGSLVATFAATGIDLLSPLTKNITLTSGNNSGGTDAGDVNLVGGFATGGNAAGGALNLTAGQSNGSSRGGDIALEAGVGGNTGAGGLVSLTGGNAGGSTAIGGHVNLTAGAGVSGNGGNIVLRAGDTTSGTKGEITFRIAGTLCARFAPSGHLEFDDAAGTPTITSGGGAGATIEGSDQAFKVTFGTTPGTTLRVTFSTAWTNTPYCFANYGASNIALRTQPATTLVDIVFASAPAAGATVEVLTVGRV